jgi:hypothetical protein
MLVKDLLTKVRLRVGDMQSSKYSDYEMLQSLNDAMKMLWIALAENFSSIPRSRREIKLVNGSAPLPENFYSLVSISDGAHVDGFRIRGSGGESVTLVYNIIPPDLTLQTSDIAYSDDDIACLDTDPLVPAYKLLPPAVGLDMAEITAAIMQGNTSAAVSIAQSTAKRISQKREYAAIPDRRHFS